MSLMSTNNRANGNVGYIIGRNNSENASLSVYVKQPEQSH